MNRLWQSPLVKREGASFCRVWATYQCTTCAEVILARGKLASRNADQEQIENIYPDLVSVAEELPDTAKKFLQQAIETLHAPDAAAVMAGSAVDAMLKKKNYKEGSLYSRIDKAVANHLLTKEMGDWAHEVRLGSNRPRHADEKSPHVNADEARQSVEFAEALGQFLFVLTDRVKKGIAKAKSSDSQS